MRLPKLIGERWASLSAADTKPSEEVQATSEPRPKSKTNWTELEKEAAKIEEEEQDPMQKFLKTIYKDADEDTKRAMLKSYSESCGTVLSTNWKDIKQKKTEIKPPDGMEYRKSS
jgi:suppressor of G2 allele of SKP1